MQPTRAPTLTLPPASGLLLLRTCAFSLLFLSGACSLAYEVIWAKLLAQLWGSSSAAIAAVVGAFLAGLGVGSYLLARRVGRFARPLRAYAVCELIIGAYALCVPKLVGLLAPTAAALYPIGESYPVGLSGLRFLLTFVLLAPATLAMGATFPLLVRQFREESHEGQTAAWLYFLNGAGAGLGALAAGFFLLPHWGIASNGAVALASMGVGGVAWALGGRLPRAHDAVDPDRPEPFGEQTPVRSFAVGAAALLFGLAALLLQMAWTRQCVLITGGSTYAFSAILTVFVFCMALGGLVYGIAPPTRNGPRAASLAVLAIGASVLFGQMLRPSLTSAVAALSELRASNAHNAAICVLVALFLAAIPTALSGYLLPLLIDQLRHRSARAGEASGRIYGWNTLGSVVGVTLAGVWLFPLLGTFWLCTAAAATYAIGLIALAGAALEFRFARTVAGLALVGLVGGGAWLSPSDATVRLLNGGAYLYGNEFLRGAGARSQLLFQESGSAANVTVLALDVEGEPKHLSVRTNGKVDGSSASSDMQTQLGAGYLPRILRPNAQSVLVIGLGTGATVGASLQLPVTSIVCCEIEPAMVKASRFFEEVNHAPLRSDRLTMVADDGRNYLQSTGAVHDLVVSVPSNPWITGVSALYTREFYRIAQGRLSPGGLLAQWMQAYQMSATDYTRAAATAASVFPHVAVLRFNDADTMLLASDQPILPGARELDHAQRLVDENATVGADLGRYFGSRDVRTLLLRHLLLDADGVQRLVEGYWDGVPNTDQNLRLEYDAPLQLFVRRGAQKTALAALYGAARADLPLSLIREWGWDDRYQSSLLDLRAQFLLRGEDGYAAQLAVRLPELCSNPAPEFRHDAVLYARGMPHRVQSEIVADLIGSAPALAQRLASQLAQRGDVERSSSVYRQLAQSFPSSATTLARLGMTLAQTGELQAAAEVGERARALDPSSDAVALLASLLEAMGE